MEEEPIVTQGQARADSIDWTEVGIGITASKSCPCMRATISVQASRMCGGDFIDGGMWMDSSDSGTACDFGDVGLQLCSAQVMCVCIIDHAHYMRPSFVVCNNGLRAGLALKVISVCNSIIKTVVSHFGLYNMVRC